MDSATVTNKTPSKTVAKDKEKITLHLTKEAYDRLNEDAETSRQRGEYVSRLILAGLPSGDGITEKMYREILAIKQLLTNQQSEVTT